jgi:hypothetical protein
MASVKTKKRTPKATAQEFDGIYLLKLSLYVILGSLWVKVSHGEGINVGVPVGFIVGLLFSSHEHFQIDRKIEYAALMVAMLVGYFAPYGLYVNF